MRSVKGLWVFAPTTTSTFMCVYMYICSRSRINYTRAHARAKMARNSHANNVRREEENEREVYACDDGVEDEIY